MQWRRNLGQWFGRQHAAVRWLVAIAAMAAFLTVTTAVLPPGFGDWEIPEKTVGKLQQVRWLPDDSYHSVDNNFPPDCAGLTPRLQALFKRYPKYGEPFLDVNASPCGGSGAVVSSRLRRDYDEIWLEAELNGHIRLLKTEERRSEIGSVFHDVDPPKPLLDENHGAEVWAGAVDREGRLVASGGGDGQVKVWSVAAARTQALDAANGTVFAVQFSDDGKILAAAGSDGRVRIWERAAGRYQEARTISDHSGPIFALALSTEMGVIATGGDDGSVRLWKLDGTWLEEAKLHEGPVLGLYWDARNRRFVSSGWDGFSKSIQLDGRSDGHRDLFWVPGRVLAASPSGKYVATVDDAAIHIWNVNSLSRYRTILGEEVTAWSHGLILINNAKHVERIGLSDEAISVYHYGLDQPRTFNFHSKTAATRPVAPNSSWPYRFEDPRRSDLATGIVFKDRLSRYSVLLPLEDAVLLPRRFPDWLLGRFRVVASRLVAPYCCYELVTATIRPRIPVPLTGILLIGIIVLTSALIIVYQRRSERRRRLDAILAPAERFLTQAGARLERSGGDMLTVKQIPGRMAAAAPFRALVAPGQPAFEEAERLIATARKNGRGGGAALLIYRDPPADSVRIRIAEASVQEHVPIVHLSLAEVDRALLANAALTILDSYAERYLEGADFFADAGAIRDEMSFFGRQKLLQRLEDDLRRGQSAGLFGLRKSGKTSLLRKIEPSFGPSFVYVSLLGGLGGERFFGSIIFSQILRELSKRLGLAIPEFPRRAAGELAADFLAHFDDLARRVPRPVVCALDEMDQVLPGRASPRERAQEFNDCFGTLRSLCQQGTMALVVTDVHPDANRINYWPQGDVRQNPLFNFLKETYVQPFSPEETTSMLRGIGALMNIHFDSEEKSETLDAIHRLSGGHPFASRQLASLLYARIATPERRTISWSQAEPLLARPLRSASGLRDYIKGAVWHDLEERNAQVAMDLVRILAFSGADSIREAELRRRLPADVTEEAFLDAAGWLADVGLLARESADDDLYRIGMPLLAQWLEMSTTPDERQRFHEPAAVR